MKEKLRFSLLSVALFFLHQLNAQETKPVNGVADKRNFIFAFTNATIIPDAGSTLQKATLLVKDGKIVAIGEKVNIPAGAVVMDCSGKFIYPSFIDLFSNYGTASAKTTGSKQNPLQHSGEEAPKAAKSNVFGWNAAIESQYNLYENFSPDESNAKKMREMGFGTVLSHQGGALAGGTGALVTLADTKANFAVIKEKGSAHFSFNNSKTRGGYPGSQMGKIALLRQTFLDADWYKSKPVEEGLNTSLAAWNENLRLPLIFEAGNKWADLQCDRIGDEFGVQFIIKGGQDEYERINEIKATKATYILPINFPGITLPKTPIEENEFSLDNLRQWELSPGNPALFEKNNIRFSITSAGINAPGMFFKNIQKAIKYGLSEKKALEVLTREPAQILGVYDMVGSLAVGKLANFLITGGPVFNTDTELLENWVQGNKYTIKQEKAKQQTGKYLLTIKKGGAQSEVLTLEIGSDKNSLYGKDSFVVDIKTEDDGMEISYNKKTSLPKADSTAPKATIKNKMLRNKGTTELQKKVKLIGVKSGKGWTGYGFDTLGNVITWKADYIDSILADVHDHKKDSAKGKPAVGQLYFPNMAYGYSENERPKQEDVLIKNATIWTNETDGVLTNADLLIKNGKIAAIGKNLKTEKARIIDGTGKHLTPGIIDEHSHIASFSINEATQSVTSEVRIKDNINPDDINIYRQLAGGVTTSHILHGSANVIGGQTQLLKLKWGGNDEEMMFKGWPGQIKFALGENVKRSGTVDGETRFPTTRMGVEQVLTDAFTRAKEYQAVWAAYSALDAKRKPSTPKPRRNLELDALVEILENKRHITCHSYVQSELLNTMDVANRFGFKINTFTHVLEGYKVANQIKAHGAGASTFSDWWAYKMEVREATPYNAAILNNVGVNVAINSDDAETARRLNQQAAKAVKYGGVTEEEALKMVTLNPAKMLHVEAKVGSLKIGKDGDVVLWSDNPLSVYAKPLYTIIEGTVYFDLEKNKEMEKNMIAERQRIIKLVKEHGGEGDMKKTEKPEDHSYRKVHLCCDDEDIYVNP